MPGGPEGGDLGRQFRPSGTLAKERTRSRGVGGDQRGQRLSKKRCPLAEINWATTPTRQASAGTQAAPPPPSLHRRVSGSAPSRACAPPASFPGGRPSERRNAPICPRKWRPRDHGAGYLSATSQRRLRVSTRLVRDHRVPVRRGRPRPNSPRWAVRWTRSGRVARISGQAQACPGPHPRAWAAPWTFGERRRRLGQGHPAGSEQVACDRGASPFQQITGPAGPRP